MSYLAKLRSFRELLSSSQEYQEFDTARIITGKSNYALNEVSGLRAYIRSFHPDSFKSLKKLRGTKNGQTALLLGGGPSVQAIDYEKLHNMSGLYDVWTINLPPALRLGLRSDDIRGHVISDPLILSAKSLSEDHDGGAKQWMHLYIDFLNDLGCGLYMPEYFRARLSGILDLEASKVYCYCDHYSRIAGGLSPVRPRRFSSLTGMKALSIILFLGYREVLISGFDSDFINDMYVTPGNTVSIVSSHYAKRPYLRFYRKFNLKTVPIYLRGYIRELDGWNQFSRLPVTNIDLLSGLDCFKKLGPTSEHIRILRKEYADEIASIWDTYRHVAK